LRKKENAKKAEQEGGGQQQQQGGVEEQQEGDDGGGVMSDRSPLKFEWVAVKDEEEPVATSSDPPVKIHRTSKFLETNFVEKEEVFTVPSWPDDALTTPGQVADQLLESHLKDLNVYLGKFAGDSSDDDLAFVRLFALLEPRPNRV